MVAALSASVILIFFMIRNTAAGEGILISFPVKRGMKELPPTRTEVPLGKWGSSIAFGDQGEIVIAGTGSILLSADSGRTWRSLSGGYGYQFTSKDGGLTVEKYGNTGSNEKGWVAAEPCYVEGSKIMSQTGRLYLRSTCDHSGQLWSIPISSRNDDWYVTYFVPRHEDSLGVLAPDFTFENARDKIFITALVPEGTAIFTTDDNGKTWYPFWRKSFLDAGVADFSFIDANTGWILKSNGLLIKTEDSGTTWNNVSSLPSDRRPHSISFASLNVGYVVGEHGLILVTRDGGKSWEDHSRDRSVNWHKVISKDGSTWIAGNSDQIIGTLDEGNNWLFGKTLNDERVYSKLTVHNGMAFFVQDQRLLSFSSVARE